MKRSRKSHEKARTMTNRSGVRVVHGGQCRRRLPGHSCPCCNATAAQAAQLANRRRRPPRLLLLLRQARKRLHSAVPPRGCPQATHRRTRRHWWRCSRSQLLTTRKSLRIWPRDKHDGGFLVNLLRHSHRHRRAQLQVLPGLATDRPYRPMPRDAMPSSSRAKTFSMRRPALAVSAVEPQSNLSEKPRHDKLEPSRATRRQCMTIVARTTQSGSSLEESSHT